MLPFGPIDDNLGRDEVLAADQAGRVRAYCQTMGAKLGCPEYIRVFFGMPIDDALREGYLMVRRGLRETTPHACARETSRFLVESAGTPSEALPVLDLCTGVGQSAFSFASAGYRVVTVENHERTYEVAKHNLTHAKLGDRVQCTYGDATEVVNIEIARGERYAAVHMDPPWGGNYDYDTRKPFRLEYVALDAPALIDRSLNLSSNVIIQLPHNVDVEEVRSLSQRLGCDAVVQYQYVSTFPAAFGLAPVYFFRKVARTSTAVDPRCVSQTLSVLGERVQC